MYYVYDNNTILGRVRLHSRVSTGIGIWSLKLHMRKVRNEKLDVLYLDLDWSFLQFFLLFFSFILKTVEKLKKLPDHQQRQNFASE